MAIRGDLVPPFFFIHGADMLSNLTVGMRNKIAKRNRQTLLAWNNTFWLSMMLLTGLKLREADLWVGGWALIAVFIETVTVLLITTDKVIKLDYFKLSFIEPIKVGIGIYIAAEILKWLF